MAEWAWVDVSPRELAMLNLRDCKEQLARSTDEPLRLALAAKSMHLALQAALTAALAGTDEAGAFDEKTAPQWRQWLEGSWDEPEPKKDRMLAFRELLDKAVDGPMFWSGRSLPVTADERMMLERLADLRDQIEHTRPWSHVMVPAYLAETLPVAARCTLEALKEVGHQLQEGEIEVVERNVAAITTLCATIVEAGRAPR